MILPPERIKYNIFSRYSISFKNHYFFIRVSVTSKKFIHYITYITYNRYDQYNNSSIILWGNDSPTQLYNNIYSNIPYYNSKYYNIQYNKLIFTTILKKWQIIVLILKGKIHIKGVFKHIYTLLLKAFHYLLVLTNLPYLKVWKGI